MWRMFILSCSLVVLVSISACDQSSGKKTTSSVQTNSTVSKSSNSNQIFPAPSAVTPEEKKEAEEQWKKAFATDKLKNGPKNNKPIEYWKK